MAVTVLRGGHSVMAGAIDIRSRIAGRNRSVEP
jgi:hypothetical protein